MAAEAVAASTGIAVHEVLTTAHRPVVASVGIPFVFAEVTGEALTRAGPMLDGFRRASEATPELQGRFSVHLYARTADGLRARMFAPLEGTFEDPATGSANATLAALLLSLGQEEAGSWQVVQGVEMGRPSVLRVTARREAGGIRATVGGDCVPVLRGEAEV